MRTVGSIIPSYRCIYIYIHTYAYLQAIVPTHFSGHRFLIIRDYTNLQDGPLCPMPIVKGPLIAKY